MADATTLTASILVTDLVGSTELRAQLGEERAESLRREHDRMLADAITRHGGTLIKGMGDGVLAMFPGAAEALAAAVDAQRAAHGHTRRKPDEPLVLRVGLSAGDINLEDGDCFGTPVIQAARLCATAESGQILAAEIVRDVDALAGAPAGFRAVGSSLALAAAVRRLRDGASAARLRPLFEPWSGLIVSSATEVWGRAGDHVLADLDIAEGKLDDAVAHLQSAIELYERNGFVLVLRASVDLVEVLVERGGPGDVAEASRLADGLAPRIAERGYDVLAERLATALD